MASLFLFYWKLRIKDSTDNIARALKELSELYTNHTSNNDRIKSLTEYIEKMKAQLEEAESEMERFNGRNMENQPERVGGPLI
jgi:predicted  nucleic acid-binding Zn-ribbon protein